MKYWIVLTLLSVIMMLPKVLADTQEVEVQLAASQDAVQQLASSLQGELMAAMQRGGPMEAIEVCHQRAAVLADEISSATGVQIGRTSLKLRSSANAPDDWERNVLLQFEAQRAAGVAAAELTHYEVVGEGDEKAFRFMRAIPTAGLCLACHGDQLSSDIQHALERWYPDDQATGYREGDVRGAFSVIQRM